MALAAVVLYELLRGLVVRAFRRRSERQIDAFLRDNRIPTDQFRHTHRMAVREMVMADADLAAAIAARAKEEEVGVHEVQARVRGWLEEIVPQFNILAYYKVGYALARTVAYSTYHVRLDQRSLEAAQADIPEGASIVYVSNHRSNADFIVTGFMLSRSVQVSYAVGEWARVWPLEGIFRSFGSYFVRRGEKDPLYHRTLQAYVQLITKQGVTQALFPEGGLSRDGAMRPVKLGLLDSMVLAKRDPAARPVVFVPVGINFDRVFEDEVLVSESGLPPRRTFTQKIARIVTLLGKGLYTVPANAVRFFAKRLKKHGVVAIHFGRPIVLDDWLAKNPVMGIDDRKKRWDALEPFGRLLGERIGQVVPATPVTLACAAAVEIGKERIERGVDRGEMVMALRRIVDRLEAAGRPFATGDPYEVREAERGAMRERVRGREDLVGVAMRVGEADDLRRILELALDVTAKRRIIYHEDGTYRSDRFDLVTYYANSLR